MKKLLSILLAVATGVLIETHAADATAPKKTADAAIDGTTKKVEKAKEKAKAKAKREWYPFQGYVSTVDKKAMTVSLKKEEGERVLRMDAKSELSRDGKPITLGEVKSGDYARGKLHKNSKDEEVILSGKFGGQPKAKEKEKDDAK